MTHADHVAIGSTQLLPADLEPRFREQIQQLHEITEILNSQSPMSLCSDCGAEADHIIGCPDGAEVCQDCFDSGSH
jgi:hypothetical protein